MKIQMVKIIFVWLVLITISVARGQTISGYPSDGYLMLYRLDKVSGRFVLSVSRKSSVTGKFSNTVVIADTFSVQPSGEECLVIMSNAYILRTMFSETSSNQVVQTQFRNSVFKQPFLKRTKLIFNNSIVELAKAKIEYSADTKTYEGDDAIRQLKKMGLEPPEDMDREKAVGHK